MRENRRQWELWTPVKAASPMYALDDFRTGGLRLREQERAEVGEVAGRTLLHLQCNIGLPTLSWGRLGAQVTGVDFAAEAIAIARDLATDVAPSARFVEANVYDLPDRLDGTFDVVHTSHGVLGWLPDLRRWAEIAAHFVAPGGFLHLWEAHPAAWTFDNTVKEHVLRPAYAYFGQTEPLWFEYRSRQAAPTADLVSVECSWGHTLADIVCALADAGLRVDYLHEWPFADWQMLPFLCEGTDGWWHLPADVPSFPLSFSLRATKPIT